MTHTKVLPFVLIIPSLLECIYCGISSIEQPLQLSRYQHAPNLSPMIQCQNCMNFMCLFCIDGFIDLIKNKKSIIENKILFSLFSLKNNIGCGGHIFGQSYVYALLDWGTKAK